MRNLWLEIRVNDYGMKGKVVPPPDPQRAQAASACVIHFGQILEVPDDVTDEKAMEMFLGTIDENADENKPRPPLKYADCGVGKILPRTGPPRSYKRKAY